MYPALQGGFFFFFLQGGLLTTGPPGKPKCMFLHDVCTTLGILNFMGDFFLHG